MSAILFRLGLLAAGLGLGEIGLDSFARGDAAMIIEVGLALILLVAGSAGFIVPLLDTSADREVSHDV